MYKKSPYVLNHLPYIEEYLYIKLLKMMGTVIIVFHTCPDKLRFTEKRLFNNFTLGLSSYGTIMIVFNGNLFSLYYFIKVSRIFLFLISKNKHTKRCLLNFQDLRVTGQESKRIRLV